MKKTKFEGFKEEVHYLIIKEVVSGRNFLAGGE